MVPRPEAQLWPYVGLVMKKTEYSKGGRKLSLIEPKSGLLTWQGDGCGLNDAGLRSGVIKISGN